MFTGIVTDLGSVEDVTATVPGARDRRFRIRTSYVTAGIAEGASIACNGCCLTLVAKGPNWFAVDVSEETLSKTTLADWKVGTHVNLERSMKISDEIGGHIVAGHIDGAGTVASMRPDGSSIRYEISVSRNLGAHIAAKGSIALDGVSLTVNDVIDRDDVTVFGVNIIPHTQTVTTFGHLQAGGRLNVEIDLMARYVARLLSQDAATAIARRKPS